MHRNTQVVGGAFVAITLAISAAMIAFGYLNKLIYFLSFIFFIAVGIAFWGVFTRHSVTDYAVGVMYATGVALAVLMVRRTVQPSPAKAAPVKQSTDSTFE